MDVENAAGILAGSILTMLALIVVVIGLVVINNIFSKYWKPIKWVTDDTRFPPRFATQDELEKIAPVLEPETKNK